MMYELFLDTLKTITNATPDTWQFLTIEIVSISMSILIFLLFFFIPIYVLKEIINLPYEEIRRKKRRR